jgi:hypothetical protein
MKIITKIITAILNSIQFTQNRGRTSEKVNAASEA